MATIALLMDELLLVQHEDLFIPLVVNVLSVKHRLIEHVLSSLPNLRHFLVGIIGTSERHNFIIVCQLVHRLLSYLLLFLTNRFVVKTFALTHHSIGGFSSTLSFLLVPGPLVHLILSQIGFLSEAHQKLFGPEHVSVIGSLKYSNLLRCLSKSNFLRS